MSVNKKSAKKKVLIVDDDFSARRLTEKNIRNNFQCDILQAEDGSQALQMMLKEEPDLVILDMMMPFMNGMQVLAAKNKDAKLKRIPVIACTAVTDTEVVKQIILAGVMDYLVKPVTEDSLIPKVAKVLQV